MSEMVERVAKAIDAVQLFSRFNDWTSDKVEGLPIEICRYGNDDENEIVIIKRFPSQKGETAALYEVVSEMRARAAIEAMKNPTDAMMQALHEAMFVDKYDATDQPMLGAGIEAVMDAALTGI